MSRLALVTAGAVTALLYGSFYIVGESAGEVLLFIGVNAVAFLVFTIVYFRLRRSEPVGTVPLVVAFGVLFRLMLVPHDPVASDDVYRYVWDGKVAASGVNPYTYAPNDSALLRLHTSELPAKVNLPEMRTIYPPLAQGAFWAANVMFGDSVAGLKLLVVLADIASLAIILLLTAGVRNRTAAVFLYAWSPLPIMYFGLDGHVDALGIPLVLMSVYFVRKSKVLHAAAVIGLSALAKLYPLFAAPLLFHEARNWKKIVLPTIPVAMLLIGGWLFWEPTGGLVESLRVFNRTFAFNGSIFHILYMIIGSNVKTHYASVLLFSGWLMVVFFLSRQYEESLFLTFIGFVLCAAVVHPWYLTWLAALLVVRWSPGIFALMGLSNLSNITVYQYRLTGVWQDFLPVLLLEYIPVFGLLAWECVTGELRRTPRVVVRKP